MMNVLKMAFDAAQETAETTATGDSSTSATDGTDFDPKSVLLGAGAVVAGLAAGYGIYRGVDYMTNRNKTAPKAPEAKKEEVKK